jgi:hypothetical protein
MCRCRLGSLHRHHLVSSLKNFTKFANEFTSQDRCSITGIEHSNISLDLHRKMNQVQARPSPNEEMAG